MSEGHEMLSLSGAISCGHAMTPIIGCYKGCGYVTKEIVFFFGNEKQIEQNVWTSPSSTNTIPTYFLYNKNKSLQPYYYL